MFNIVVILVFSLSRGIVAALWKFCCRFVAGLLKYCFGAFLDMSRILLRSCCFFCRCFDVTCLLTWCRIVAGLLQDCCRIVAGPIWGEREDCCRIVVGLLRDCCEGLFGWLGMLLQHCCNIVAILSFRVPGACEIIVVSLLFYCRNFVAHQYFVDSCQARIYVLILLKKCCATFFVRRFASQL